jgi:hypothetical protein
VQRRKIEVGALTRPRFDNSVDFVALGHPVIISVSATGCVRLRTPGVNRIVCERSESGKMYDTGPMIWQN